MESEQFNNVGNIIVKAGQFENEIIPVWELSCIEDPDLGLIYYKDDPSWSTNHLVDVFYNVNTKKISKGVSLSYKEPNCIVSSNALLIRGTAQEMMQVELEEITWVLGTSSILFEREAQEYYEKIFPDQFWDFNKVYNIQVLSPRYKFKNHKKLFWPHDVFELK